MRRGSRRSRGMWGERAPGAAPVSMTVGSPITFNDDVILDQNTTLNASGLNSDVTFNKTVNSATGLLRTLTVNATGVTTFASGIGNVAGGTLGSLTTDAPGSLILGNGGAFSLTVQDTIDLNDPITLKSTVTFTSVNNQAIT